MTTPANREHDDEWVEIGVVAQPHGLRGELKVLGVDDEMARFRRVGEVQLVGRGGAVKGRVRRFRSTGRQVLLQVVGVESREDADRLRGATVSVRKSEVPALEEGAYYAFELVGCEVFTASGERVGVVSEIRDYPANDVLVVHRGGRELLIPLVEPVVARVDIKGRRIDLKDIEGLLE